MLYYALYANRLIRNSSEEQVARPINITTRTLAYLISQEISRKGSILKDTEINAVINGYWKAIIRTLAKGETYHGPYISVSVSKTGVFEDKNGLFDVERHQLKVNISPGSALKEATKNV